MFKKKIWTEQERNFTPPYPGELRYGAGTEDFANRTLFGFTTIIYVNQFGDIKTEIFIGNQTAEGRQG